MSASSPNSARRQSSARRAARGSIIESRGGTTNAMKVYIRVRPFSKRELSQKMDHHSTVLIDKENPSILTTLDPANYFRPQSTFSFTRCFWSVLGNEGTDKDREMNQMRDAVDTFLNGGMNNAPSARRRSRAASMVTGSARPRQPGAPFAVDDISVGSAAAMSEGAGVTHPPYAGQDEVYNYVGKPILENTLEGYNGCIFAYGQTGSGKTFTMLGYAPNKKDLKRQDAGASAEAADIEVSSGADGDADAEVDEEEDAEFVVDRASLDPNNLQGIIPRISTEMFSGLTSRREQDSSLSYRVEVSYYEIYNERIFDLLNRTKNNELRSRNTPNGPIVDNLTVKTTSKPEEVAKLIRKGSQERHTAATKFNDRSSRSHAILTFTIKQVYMDSDDTLCTRVSKLHLVDLAGSERTGAAGAEGSELLEGNKINQSLMVLGRVIDCLADLSQNKSLAVPVPYRESNLTWLLMDSLGGNSRTSMIATISPHALNFDEMRQTIRYASRAKQIVQRAVVNEDPQRMLVRSLKAKIASLEALLSDSGAAQYTTEYVQSIEKEVEMLRETCNEQEETIGALRARIGESDTDPFAPTIETVRMQLSEANAEITRLQIELSSASVDADSPGGRGGATGGKGSDTAEVKRLERTVKELEAEQRAAAQAQLMRVRMLREFEYHYSSAQPMIIADAFFQKAALVMRSCEAVVAKQNDQLRLWAVKGEKEFLYAKTDLLSAHNDEIRDLRERNETALDEMRLQFESREREAERRQRDELDAAEKRAKEARAFYEQEKKRLEAELEAQRTQGAAELAKVRAEYLDDLHQLRSSLHPSSGTAAPADDGAAVKAAEAQVEKLKGAMAELKEAHSDEMRAQRERHREQLEKKEKEITDRETQKRALEKELSDLRKDNLKLQVDNRNALRDAQSEFREKRRQQDEIVQLARKMVGSWQEDDVEDVADKMMAIKGVLDGGLSTSGPVSPRPSSATPTSAAAASGGARAPAGGAAGAKPKDPENFRVALEKLKNARKEQKEKLAQFQKSVYEDVSKIRGHTPTASGPEKDA